MEDSVTDTEKRPSLIPINTFLHSPTTFPIGTEAFHKCNEGPWGSRVQGTLDTEKPP